MSTRSFPVRLFREPMPDEPVTVPAGSDKVYVGRAGKVWVHSDNGRRRLPHSFVHGEFSNYGWAWGNNTDERQTQLAVDLLVNAMGEEAAGEHYADFSRLVLGKLENAARWTMSDGEIRDHVASLSGSSRGAEREAPEERRDPASGPSGVESSDGDPETSGGGGEANPTP